MSQLARSTPGNFHLNYDQESPLLPIDRGGHDQALKYVRHYGFVMRVSDEYCADWPSSLLDP